MSAPDLRMIEHHGRDIPGNAAAGRLLLWTALLCVLTLSRAWADTQRPAPLVIDPRQQFAFAEAYYAGADYARAVSEFQRFIFFFADVSPAAQIDQARYYIGLAHYRAGDYGRALAAFDDLIAGGKTPPLVVKSYLMKKNCHAKQGDTVQAIITLNNLMVTAGDADTRDRARYELGWLYIQDGQWKAAQASFDGIGPVNRRRYDLERLTRALDSSRDIPRKSPVAAGLLAVIPGAGYAYCQRPRDALISLAVNAAFMFSALEAFDHENPALGSLLALVGLGFYSANIYGSLNSAHKYNRSATGAFIKTLKRNLRVEISAAPRLDGLGLALAYRF